MERFANASKQSRGRQIKNVLGVNMPDFVRDDGKRFFIVQTFDQTRMKHDDRLFNSARKGIDDRILLDKQIGHINAQRRAGDLQFGVQIGTLFRRNLHGARHKYHANRRFARNL